MRTDVALLAGRPARSAFLPSSLALKGASPAHYTNKKNIVIYKKSMNIIIVEFRGDVLKYGVGVEGGFINLN